MNNILKCLFFASICALTYALCVHMPYALLFYSERAVDRWSFIVNAIALDIAYMLVFFYACTLLKTIGKSLIWIILLTSLPLLYFSLTYGLLQSREMFELVFNTNIQEIKSILSFGLVWTILAAVAVAWLVTHWMPVSRPCISAIGVLAVLALVVIPVKKCSPVHIHTWDLMPFSYVCNAAHAIKQQRLLHTMIAGRSPLPHVCRMTTDTEPLYIVLALGDSLRADHLPWYGYHRNTTPNTSNVPFIRYRTCYSAGSDTIQSVTRMLTRATIRHPENVLKEKTLINAYSQADFRTIWLTNQTSMSTTETQLTACLTDNDIVQRHGAVYSVNKKVRDADLLPMLDDALALPAKNTLITLHSFGSHGNTEERYDDIFRIFTPVCTKLSPLDCTEEESVNSYDNSVLATDAYWDEVIRRLEGIKAVLLITSDHGERLHGKYRMHGPRLMNKAPLRWVPLMLWASPKAMQDPRIATKMAQAAKYADMPISHDVIFHSLLGLADIQTDAYDETLDLFGPKCREHVDPYVKLQGNGQTLQE